MSSKIALNHTPLTAELTMHKKEPSVELISPQQLRNIIPCTKAIANRVQQQRIDVRRILDGQDDRLLVVVGPCSIHDPESALDFAQRLQKAQSRFKQELLIIMRVYLEKPRTTVGWKGLINDPHLNGKCDINEGYQIGRQLLQDIQNMGVCCGTEFIHPITAHYISDFITWSAIGARTVTSPLHRELASDLPSPVGFKNTLCGNVDHAINAMITAKKQHATIISNEEGTTIIKKTSGNPYGHIILRGSQTAPNYHEHHVQKAIQSISKQQLSPQRIMIDCSHGNSGKVPNVQIEVAQSVCRQISEGQKAIIGIMLESHILEGKQQYAPDTQLAYGQSITDACINWERTEELLHSCSRSVQARRQL
ncbi:MAG: 3-deoxy-7-phosphoheptulonate synthase [Coxiellaceae bacterium]|nr:3-deoxy-7-phosphoheptulonate synthase [Coxiellaceae bacterium]|tara:strand:+ start:1636 stop:2730 length:1095 start_codon:yes stop_codon:yes gene_type:complete